MKLDVRSEDFRGRGTNGFDQTEGPARRKGDSE